MSKKVVAIIRLSVLYSIAHLRGQRRITKEEAKRLESFIRSLNENELTACVFAFGGESLTLLEEQGVVVRAPVPASWD